MRLPTLSVLLLLLPSLAWADAKQETMGGTQVRSSGAGTVSAITPTGGTLTVTGDLDLINGDPHVRLCEAENLCHEIYRDQAQFYITNLDTSQVLIRFGADDSINFAQSVNFSTALTLQNGEYIANATDGNLQLCENNVGECVNFSSPVSNTVSWGSSTGVTTMRWSGMNTLMLDDLNHIYGTASDSEFQWDTAEGNDSLKLGLVLNSSASSGNFLITELADINVNFGVGTVSNPTIRIQSADATTTTDALRLFHNQTDAVIDTVGGNLNLEPAGGTVAVTGAVTATTTMTSSNTTTLGWSVVAGADTACSTTCTSACVMGVNTGSANADIVDCADATADECLCAGGS